LISLAVNFKVAVHHLVLVMLVFICTMDPTPTQPVDNNVIYMLFAFE